MNERIACHGCARGIEGAASLCAACRVVYHPACWGAQGCGACACAKPPIAARFDAPVHPLRLQLARVLMVGSACAVVGVLGALYTLRVTLVDLNRPRPAMAYSSPVRPLPGRVPVPPLAASQSVGSRAVRRSFQPFADPAPAFVEIRPALAAQHARAIVINTVPELTLPPAKTADGVVYAPLALALGTAPGGHPSIVLHRAANPLATDVELTIEDASSASPTRPMFLRVEVNIAHPSCPGMPAGREFERIADLALAHAPRQTIALRLPPSAAELRFHLTGDRAGRASPRLRELPHPVKPVPSAGFVIADARTPVFPGDRTLTATAFDPLLNVGVDLFADGSQALFTQGAGHETVALAQLPPAAALTTALPDAMDRMLTLPFLHLALMSGPRWAQAFVRPDSTVGDAVWRAGLTTERGRQRLMDFLVEFALPRLRIAHARR